MSDRKKILIVDDEKDFVMLIRGRLEHEGYEVLEAPDGIQGLSVLRKNQVDLILLDIMMPFMDGFTFYKTIKEEEAVISVPPIIFVTAYGQDLTDDQKKLIGNTPILNKPFDSGDLLKKISEII